MMKWLALTLVGSVMALPAFAAENCGTFVRYEPGKKVLTVNCNDKETEYELTDSVKLLTPKGDPAKQGLELFSDRQRAKVGAPLTVITETRNGKEVVVEIKLGKTKK
jgi:hypothetical protein